MSFFIQTELEIEITVRLLYDIYGIAVLKLDLSSDFSKENIEIHLSEDETRGELGEHPV